MALYNWLIAENAGKQYKSVFYIVDKIFYIVDKNKIIRYFLRMKNSVVYFYLKLDMNFDYLFRSSYMPV